MAVRSAEPIVTATAATPRVWVAYARLSRKKVGRAKRRRNDQDSVEWQLKAMHAWAANEGIVIAVEYIDNHLSAWKEDGTRPAFDAMIAAAERGEIAGIIVWKIDRFTRRTQDALDFTRVAERQRVKIDGPQSGTYNLSTGQAQQRFREDASKAEAESKTISERVGAKFQTYQPMGLLLGAGRHWGFMTLDEARGTINPATGEPLAYDDDREPVVREDEAEVIREVARRRLADRETWVDLAADLNSRGLLTPRGNPWRPSVLRGMLAAPRYGGYITRKGEIVAQVRGNGNPILDAETYHQLQADFHGRRRGGKPSDEFYLTRAAFCVCGRTLAGSHSSNRKRRYVCPGGEGGGCGKISMMAHILEPVVREAVLRASADPDARAVLALANVEVDDARRELREQISAQERVIRGLDAKLENIEIRYNTDQMREQAYEGTKAALDGLMAKALAKRDVLLGQMPAEGAPSGAPPVLTADLWDDAPPDEKRAYIASLHLTITVHPRKPGTSRAIPDPTRIKISDPRGNLITAG